MTRNPTTHQTIATKRGPRTVQVEKRTIAGRVKQPIAGKSPKLPRYAAKSGGVAISVANRDPWALVSVFGGLNDISKKGNLKCR